jgi:hypothetical protein
VQVSDSTDWERAQGVPMRLRRFGDEDPHLPGESEIVDVPPWPTPRGRT